MSFKEAVIKGIAPDKGLYFPERIPKIDKKIFDRIDEYSNQELAYEMIKEFVGDDIPETDLKAIIEDTLSFDFPLVQIEEGVFCLNGYNLTMSGGSFVIENGGTLCQVGNETMSHF